MPGLTGPWRCCQGDGRVSSPGFERGARLGGLELSQPACISPNRAHLISRTAITCQARKTKLRTSTGTVETLLPRLAWPSYAKCFSLETLSNAIYYVTLSYFYVGWYKMSGGRASQLGRASSPPGTYLRTKEKYRQDDPYLTSQVRTR